MKHSGTDTPSSHPAPPETLMFFAGLYGDVVDLLLDAQDYFSAQGEAYQAKATPVERLVYSSEMSRVTLRLSSIMAWLMARRAEHAGQITPEEAATRFRLTYSDVCTKELPEMKHVLPKYMCMLIKRSLELYRRAERLDTMLAKQVLH